MWRRVHRSSDPGGLKAALSAVAEEARWEALVLIARRGRGAAPDLLRGHAADLSGSSLARVQLLSLALDRAADLLDAGAEAPEIDMDGFLRIEEAPADVLSAVQGWAASPTVINRARSGIDRIGREHAGRSSILAQDALLNERLWCDARLPASPDTRAVMLAAIPFLRARASAARRRPAGLKALWRRTWRV